MESTDTWIVKISFAKSRSERYQAALHLASSLPHFNQKDGVTVCGIRKIEEYLLYQDSINALIFMVERWKSTRILFYGRLHDAKVASYFAFRECVIADAGKYACLLTNSEITMEDLPLPIVYYPRVFGAFFGFSRDVGEAICFCECERAAINNYIRLRKLYPLEAYRGPKRNPLGSDYFPRVISEISTRCPQNPLSLFKFMPNICFRCNHKIPRKPYCDAMYASEFYLTHGWYINQKYLEFGIDPRQITSEKILKECCPSDLYHSIQDLEKIKRQKETEPDNKDLSNEIKAYSRGIRNFVEDAVRIEFGFLPKGSAWVNETLLYNIIKGLYPKRKIIRHYRPDWLDGLELDIFLPALNLAFEYQGIQHFKPVEYWGGKPQLKRQQEHDARKLQICEEKNICLLYFYYYDKLTIELVKNRILNHFRNAEK